MSTFNAKSALMARQQPSLSDVIQAIKAHTQCTSRIQYYLDGRTSESIDPDAIGEHASCALGHWLSTTCVMHYGDIPLLQEAIENHARLHFTARHIVLRYKDGAHEEALDYLYEGAFPNNAHIFKLQLGELAQLINNHHPSMASSMVLDEIFRDIRKYDFGTRDCCAHG